jgi:hypothetical protein
MPRHQHVLTVFLASPSDVREERETVEEVIRDFNLAWSRSFGICLDLVRWETHAFPGAGDDSQAVINDQIPDDYDVFMGIMWCRFGTPTGRAGSGTVEEFYRARERFKRDPSSIKLMFYFKDREAAPLHTDPNQLVQVGEFQSALQADGVLYWQFSDPEHFRRLASIHLARQVQNSGAFKALFSNPQVDSRSPNDVETIVPNLAFSRTDDDSPFPTMMSAHQVFMDRSLDSINSSATMNSLFSAFKKQADDTAQGINALAAMVTADPEKVNAALNALPQKFAQLIRALNQLTAGLERELPLYCAASSAAMDAFIGSAVARIGMGRNERLLQMHAGSLQGIIKWRNITEQLQRATQNAFNSISIIPEATEELAVAKRHAMLALSRLIVQRGNELVLLREGEILVRDLLGQQS